MNELKFAMYVRLSKKEENNNYILNINMISQTLAKIRRKYTVQGEIKNKIFPNKYADIKIKYWNGVKISNIIIPEWGIRI
jgi:predicted transcriptional regulator